MDWYANSAGDVMGKRPDRREPLSFVTYLTYAWDVSCPSFSLSHLLPPPTHLTYYCLRILRTWRTGMLLLAKAEKRCYLVATGNPSAGMHHVQRKGEAGKVHLAREGRRKQSGSGACAPSSLAQAQQLTLRLAMGVEASRYRGCTKVLGAMPLAHCKVQIVPSALTPLPVHCGERCAFAQQ